MKFDKIKQRLHELKCSRVEKKMNTNLGDLEGARFLRGLKWYNKHRGLGVVY